MTNAQMTGVLVTATLGIIGWLIIQLMKAKDDKTNANGIAIGQLSDRFEQSHGRLVDALEGLNKTMTSIQITMAKDYVTWDDLRANCYERRKTCRNPDND